MQRDINGNPSIKCTVNSCAYHANSSGLCTLNSIDVGCTKQNVSECQATECSSFQLGDHGTNCGCR